MTALYLFAAAAGVPLVAWFLFGGGDQGGAEDAGGAGPDDGIGGIMLRLLPLSTVAIVLATFGVCGLVLGLVAGDGVTLAGSAVAAAAAGALNSAVFSYLRRDATSSVGDAQLAGAVGRVILPVAAERRGRITVSVGGQQVYLSARALPDGAAAGELEAGAPVLVVEVRDGVASVTRLDPELQ